MAIVPSYCLRTCSWSRGDANTLLGCFHPNLLASRDCANCRSIIDGKPDWCPLIGQDVRMRRMGAPELPGLES